MQTGQKLLSGVGSTSRQMNLRSNSSRNCSESRLCTAAAALNLVDPPGAIPTESELKVGESKPYTESKSTQIVVAESKTMTTAEAVAAQKQKSPEFFSVAQQLYDLGLQRILEFIDRKGMWRVYLHATGIVTDLQPAKASRPQPSTFVVHMPGNGAAPRFGSFNQLSETQEKIAAAMRNDVGRLLTARSVADLAEGSPTKASAQTRQTVAELEARFGRLPRSPVCDAIEARRVQDRTLREKTIEREQVLASIPTSIFDDYVAEEKSRISSSARQL